MSLVLLTVVLAVSAVGPNLDSQFLAVRDQLKRAPDTEEWTQGSFGLYDVPTYTEMGRPVLVSHGLAKDSSEARQATSVPQEDLPHQLLQNLPLLSRALLGTPEPSSSEKALSASPFSEGNEDGTFHSETTGVNGAVKTMSDDLRHEASALAKSGAISPQVAGRMKWFAAQVGRQNLEGLARNSMAIQRQMSGAQVCSSALSSGCKSTSQLKAMQQQLKQNQALLGYLTPSGQQKLAECVTEPKAGENPFGDPMSTQYRMCRMVSELDAEGVLDNPKVKSMVGQTAFSVALMSGLIGNRVGNSQDLEGLNAQVQQDLNQVLPPSEPKDCDSASKSSHCSRK